MYKIGMDIGSTTIKCVVLDQENKIVYQSYDRHRALVKEKTRGLLHYINESVIDKQSAYLALTGSASIGVAEKFGIPFIQEVMATQMAVDASGEEVDVVIELGGEDAKILFLTNGVEVRMNGSCAGGTGAFIDQMAALLDVAPEELDQLALTAKRVYPIASRCGVFAKSDIQPLLNQGAAKGDIAASIFGAVVNQTIGGLAQGRDLKGRIMFLGGPLTFFKALQLSFTESLHLSEENGIFPEDAQYYVAKGAAYYSKEESVQDLTKLLLAMDQDQDNEAYQGYLQPLFADLADYEAFVQRHQQAKLAEESLISYQGNGYLGIDAGSTTVKVVLIGEDEQILFSCYETSKGNPVSIVKRALLEIYNTNPSLKIKSSATTGYGEELIKKAFNVDYGVVETMAHLAAAQKFMPQVDFIIDIGGQDIKCFKIKNKIIDTIFLNEACSSGCGSFIGTFASALGYSVQEFAQLGLYAKSPVDLGTRCTVFMNSSVKQAQKEGAEVEDISAGLSVSVVKNALYKVIRVNSKEDLGEHIVVQGGTFLNDSILRAFELEVATEVVRPPNSGLMGALGAALYAKRQPKNERSGVLTKEELQHFNLVESKRDCQICGNHCNLTVTRYNEGQELIAGNRCERPIMAKQSLQVEKNAFQFKRQLLLQRKSVKEGKLGRLGLLMGLNMMENYHFWHPLFTQLGFEVVSSPFATRDLYLKGQHTIPSDTVCYPAKLMHGHLEYLLEKGIKDIFYPCLTYNFDEKISDNHYNCPVVAYYPEVLRANIQGLADVNFIMAYLGIHQPKTFAKKLYEVLAKDFAVSKHEVKKAVESAYAAQEAYQVAIKAFGKEAIAYARAEGMPIVVLAGRPYHIDPEINHGIDKLITSYGAVVISEDCLPLEEVQPKTKVLNQWTYHARLYNAAHYISRQSDMYLIQLVSFGCGLDAVTTDEVREILEANHQIYTQIKIDEISNLGAIKIRLRSLFAAIQQKRGVVFSE